MSKLVRFGVAVDADLLSSFDRVIERKGYTNRSEALRDVMRERLIEEGWRTDAETVGVITLVYDHSVRELQARLTELQHNLAGQVISTLHVHIDAKHCLEVILVRGTGLELGRFADRLVGLKGVVYGRLLPATLGHGLWRDHEGGAVPAHPHPHSHDHPHEHPHEHPPAPVRRRAAASTPGAAAGGPPRRRRRGATRR